jgi:hypothetical protein
VFPAFARVFPAQTQTAEAFTAALHTYLNRRPKKKSAFFAFVAFSVELYQVVVYIKITLFREFFGLTLLSENKFH